MNKKNYYIFAGVNGAGKSTFFRKESIKKLNLGKRINTDEIVREIGDWKNPADQMKAGRIALQLRKEYIKAGIDFNQETTLAGKSILKAIRNAKENGYTINMYYMGVESTEIAKERVRNRVAKGGHDIADKDIEKRYIDSLKNLKEIALVCDNLYIFDNSEEEHIRCFSKINNKIEENLEIKKYPMWSKEIHDYLVKELQGNQKSKTTTNNKERPKRTRAIRGKTEDKEK